MTLPLPCEARERMNALLRGRFGSLRLFTGFSPLVHILFATSPYAGCASNSDIETALNMVGKFG
ncbi:hypothetical protein MAMT_00431 [Methylacidimicrobium tartarophylax]|uniref:Uncharacterized protein n=1 Tax=Methylacidimicrobium tartarophylax TaxID=1041768 RepID=A0A5E6M9K4_9BACT|nr:hypothetical protein MAMT_00431 [Methylacidimicrobium tartarophylax]